MIAYDGHFYEDAESIPDLGSLQCTGSVNGKREYYGISTDIDKLPTKADYPEYKDLITGSTAFFVDTSAVYMYSSSTDTWYEI